MSQREGTVNIQVQLNVKGLLLLGGVVYVAARAGTARALKKGPSLVQTVFTPVVDEVKRQWDDAQSPKNPGDGPTIPQQPNGN
jgi:hypothetical protein